MKYLIAITLVLLLGACSGAPELPENATTLPECGWRPNCVNSQNGEGGHAIDPITATAAQWAALKTWISEQPNWEISRDNDTLFQAVAITPKMRYRDDVIMLFNNAEQSIDIRSSSRVGIGDMGANAARVEMLRQQVTQL